MYLIDVFLGFLIVQVAHILNKDRESENSPKKFSLIFFIKDTWLKILLSLILSVSISTAIHLHSNGVEEIFNVPIWILYLVVGGVPEWALQQAKDKLGFLQPKTVSVKVEAGFETKKETFVRK